ncbi:hypothetical protein MP228_003228 [Amoeboaphelidium protococcarum]|nr:hypothetical protein MP228_003228 [Amoeboaphelidium protococcarum]
MSNMRRVFVANADTAVGCGVVCELLDNEKFRGQINELWCTVRHPERSGLLWSKGACVIEMGDQPDEGQLRKHLEGVDTLIVVPDWATGKMVDQTKLILKAAHQSQVQRVMLISRAGIDGQDNKTAQNYCNMEKCLREFGFQDACIVRLVCLQQSLFLHRLMMMERSKLEWPLNEDAKFTMINMHNVVKFICNDVLGEGSRKLKSGGNVEMYRLSGPTIITPRQLVDVLNKNVGLQLQYQKVDPQHIQRYFQEQLGLRETLTRELLDEFDLVNKGKLNFVSDDTKKKIGEEPEKLDHFIKDHRSLFHMKQGGGGGGGSSSQGIRSAQQQRMF